MHDLSTIKKMNDNAERKYKREQKLLRDKMNKLIENFGKLQLIDISTERAMKNEIRNF